MTTVQYSGRDSVSVSPAGQNSSSMKEFQHRMSEWHPNWAKIVRLSADKIDYEQLRLARYVYLKDEPDLTEFKNKATVLLFEETDCFRVVRADFFTRLLFTEQRFIERPFDLGSSGSVTIASALSDRRDPTDPFWGAVGLPGVPLAIGVNASLRSHDYDGVELLAHKSKQAQGEMGGTVGPPVSAGVSLDLDELSFGHLTLGALVDHAMQAAAKRELGSLVLPPFRRRKAWLDSGRGHKPEVNYQGTIHPGDAAKFNNAICQTHSGCLQVQGHLTMAGMPSEAASALLSNWGLNFQTWCLWL